MSADMRGDRGESETSVPSVILGVKLTAKQKNSLLLGEESELMTGFINKDGETFDAYIRLNEKKQLIFRLPEKQEGLKKDDGDRALYSAQINLVEFSKIYGFREKRVVQEGKTKFVNEAVMIENGSDQQLIVIRDASTSAYRYHDLHHPRNEGAIFDFIEYFKAGTSEEAQQEIVSFLKSQAHAPTAATHLKGTSKAFEEAFKEVFGLIPLENREGLYTATISDATIDHAFFRGKIFNQPATGGSSAVFPLFLEEQYSGVWSAPQEDAGPNEDPRTDYQNGIWISNVIHENKVRRMILVNHPMDALAYHQLYAKPSDLFTFYVAAPIKAGVDHVKEIQWLIDRYEPEQLILASDLGLQGMYLNASILGLVSEPRAFLDSRKAFREDNSEIYFTLTPIGYRSNHFLSLKIVLTYSNQEKGVFMNENLVAYFKHLAVKEWPTFFNERAFPDGPVQIGSVGKYKSDAEVVFPFNIPALEMLEKIIQHLRPAQFVKIDKPKEKSFLEQLKQTTATKLATREARRKSG